MNATPKIYELGDATITRIEELVLRDFHPGAIFPGWLDDLGAPAQSATGHADSLLAGRLLLSVHTWLVRDRNRVILVDTGVGNDKPRPFTPYFSGLRTPFLEQLAIQGIRPDQVDFVLMTHLHVDHVGWNTHLENGRWAPTFPNAQYIFSKTEYEYFTDPANNNERNKTSFIVQQDSVKPIVEAGQARMIEIDGSQVIDGFHFLPTPGHTIDHSSILFTRGTDTALFPGDVLHHPLQVRRPDLNSVFDAFEDRARQSRRRALEIAADRDALVFTTHFPPGSAGKVLRTDGQFEWRFC